jgi:hypothetical protein
MSEVINEIVINLGALEDDERKVYVSTLSNEWIKLFIEYGSKMVGVNNKGTAVNKVYNMFLNEKNKRMVNNRLNKINNLLNENM